MEKPLQICISGGTGGRPELKGIVKLQGVGSDPCRSAASM